MLSKSWKPKKEKGKDGLKNNKDYTIFSIKYEATYDPRNESKPELTVRGRKTDMISDLDMLVDDCMETLERLYVDHGLTEPETTPELGLSSNFTKTPETTSPITAGLSETGYSADGNFQLRSENEPLRLQTPKPLNISKSSVGSTGCSERDIQENMPDEYECYSSLVESKRPRVHSPETIKSSHGSISQNEDLTKTLQELAAFGLHDYL